MTEGLFLAVYTSISTVFVFYIYNFALSSSYRQTHVDSVDGEYYDQSNSRAQCQNESGSEGEVHRIEMCNSSKSNSALVFLYCILSSAFTLAVNLLYVTFVESLPRQTLVAAQISFGIFKSLYSHLPVYLKNQISDSSNFCLEYREAWNRIANINFRLALNMFSIMIAPCFATSLANSNCFLYVWSHSPLRSIHTRIAVNSRYSVQPISQNYKRYFILVGHKNLEIEFRCNSCPS